MLSYFTTYTPRQLSAASGILVPWTTQLAQTDADCICAQLARSIVSFLLVLAQSFAIYHGMAALLNNESPIVVVLSESMEPAFQRGDLLLLSMSSEPIRAGDICVYKLKGQATPIVHRILEVHEE
eukprot:jgi/Hompol1/6944/HPOL_000976-RA